MQSTGVLNLGIGLTGVKEKCGVHLSYMYLARTAAFTFPLFHPRPSVSNCRRALTRSRATARLQAAVAAPPQPPRPVHSTRHAPSTLPTPSRRRHVLPPPQADRRPCARAAPHRHLRRHAPPCDSMPLRAIRARPRRSAAYATHMHSPAQPSHPMLAGCSSFCLSRSSHCFRAAFVFPHTHATASRDGSREEEGEGSRGREARPQADSHREREAERAEMVAKAAKEQASGHARPFAIREQPARGRGRGRGMGRVRGARATRATTQQTEGDTSEGEPTAAESDHSVSDADSEAEQSEQSQGQSTQGSPTP